MIERNRYIDEPEMVEIMWGFSDPGLIGYAAQGQGVLLGVLAAEYLANYFRRGIREVVKEFLYDCL